MAASDSRDLYMLGTGGQAADRLRLLDEIFGPSSRELLNLAGLASGI